MPTSMPTVLSSTHWDTFHWPGCRMKIAFCRAPPCGPIRTCTSRMVPAQAPRKQPPSASHTATCSAGEGPPLCTQQPRSVTKAHNAKGHLRAKCQGRCSHHLLLGLLWIDLQTQRSTTAAMCNGGCSEGKLHMLLLLLMQSYTRLWAGRGRAARTHHSDKGGEEDSHKKQRAELGTGAGGENTHTHTHMSHTHTQCTPACGCHVGRHPAYQVHQL